MTFNFCLNLKIKYFFSGKFFFFLNNIKKMAEVQKADGVGSVWNINSWHW